MDCKEKVGLLKILEILTESGREGGNSMRIGLAAYYKIAFMQKYHYFRSCIYTCINLHNHRSHGEDGHHRRTEHQKLKGIGN
ncbi:MAG: hypothetical protein M3P08_13940 [Thermoproteota archaeon]|nr:hypothetical protein [Thermoproteota archaeon]